MAEILSGDAAGVKKALRQDILARRDAMPAGERARVSEVVFARVLALPEYAASGAIFCYAGFGSELDTFPFMRRILADGKTLVMSKINKATRVLDLYRVTDLDADLAAGMWGIREPDPARCTGFDAAGVDFVLVPGSVFDANCGRMGYGGGFYDKLLAPLAPKPFLVAAACDLQIVDAVPTEAHDQPLDMVMTETRAFRRPR